MKIFRFLPLFLLPALVFLVSCKTSYVVPIEIQKPGILIIPGKVEGLLIVNNAVPQPGDQIVTLKINQKNADIKQKIQTDTALWATVILTSKNISDANFFEKTSLYQEALRNDNEWLAVKPLSKEKCDSLYNESECNVILSIDRLVFDMEHAAVNTVNNNIFGPDGTFLYTKCRGLLTSSIYTKNKKTRLTSFNIQDSINVNSVVQGDSARIFQEIPNIIIKELSNILSTRLAYYFIPDWILTERTIYTSSNSKMLKADRYFEKKDWENARILWEELFYRKEKNTALDKARMAMNIGTAYEMEDNLIMAVYWVQKAISIYSTVEKTEKEKQEASEYLGKLNTRIQNNKILDMQYDE